MAKRKAKARAGKVGGKKVTARKKARTKKALPHKARKKPPALKAKRSTVPRRKKSTVRRTTSTKSRRGPHHVIIGAGPAGINAIETIRQIDGGASRISIICDEPPYSRMVLPYYIAQRIPRKQVFTADPGYFENLGVEFLHGRRAVYVDTKASMVTLQDGERVAYDDLLIATGSSPARPVFPGSQLPGVETLWTLNDTERVLKRLGSQGRVVFLGAGFIGFIVLNALAKRGCQLEVVEQQSQVLPYMLDMKAGEFVASHLRSQQIGVHTGTSVATIHERAGRLTAELTNGSRLVADAVVLATGVRPNLGFLEGSGLHTRRGLLVDDRLRTNVKNVYAAGDCAEGPDLLNGERTVHAIQPTAVDHGRVVGANMAGSRARFRGSLLMNILDVVGLQCASFGQWNADTQDVQTLANPTRGSYRKLLWKEDCIAGAILLGPSRDVSNLNDMGMVKGIVQTQAKLGPWKDYLRSNPLDIRRAYLGAGVAQTLLNTTLLGTDALDRGYRYKKAAPTSKPTPHHKVFVRDFVPAPPAVAGPPH